MTAATTESIEALVSLYCGQSDRRTQHIFRQHLQVLVEVSKAEQRNEDDLESNFDNRNCARGVVH